MSEKTRRQQIQEMLAQEPNDPELRYMLGMEHASAEDDEAAVQCFEELLQLTPTYVPGYHQAARVLARLNRVAEARAMLEHGVPIALQQGNQHAAGEMQEFLDGLR